MMLTALKMTFIQFLVFPFFQTTPGWLRDRVKSLRLHLCCRTLTKGKVFHRSPGSSHRSCLLTLGFLYFVCLTVTELQIPLSIEMHPGIWQAV